MKLAANLRAGVFIAILALVAPLSASAAPLVPGAALPALALTDQHGKPVTVDAGTKILVFSADKAASQIVQETLVSQPAGVLSRLEAVYVADISAMPSVITRLFALPKLREQPFPVGLGYDAAQLADLPRQAGMATVLRLHDGKVTSVAYARDDRALREAIGLPQLRD